MLVATTSHPLAETARRICESRGGKWSGTKGMARCPAHDDRTPSLGVSLGRGAILLHCFAGCDQESVLAALARDGVPASALFSGGPIEPKMDTGLAAKPSAAALRIWRDAQRLHASPAKAYLESRGIPPEVAERLVVLGFFDDVLAALPVGPLRADLRARVAAKLSHRLVEAAT